MYIYVVPPQDLKYIYINWSIYHTCESMVIGYAIFFMEDENSGTVHGGDLDYKKIGGYLVEFWLSLWKPLQ